MVCTGDIREADLYEEEVLNTEYSSSHLIGFPFALGIFLFLVASLSAIFWGITLGQVWLAVVGFVITLLAGWYGARALN